MTISFGNKVALQNVQTDGPFAHTVELRKAITTKRIADIQMDVFFSNPDHILQALNVNIAEGDEEGVRFILAECQRRDIDLAPAMRHAAAQSHNFYSTTPLPVSGKPFRLPIKTLKGKDNA